MDIAIPATMALTEFTPFPRLPKELRFKIWKQAASEIRIVEIGQLSSCDIMHITTGVFEAHSSPIFFSPTSNPIVLSINRESRMIALENYSLSFPNIDYPAQIYYNPSVDVLYLPNWCSIFLNHIPIFEKATPDATKKRIRRIAVDKFWRLTSSRAGWINDEIELDKFSNLEELLLIERMTHEHRCGCYRYPNHKRPENGVPEFVELGELREEGYRNYYDMALTKVAEGFQKFREKDPDCKLPSVRVVKMRRDGILV